MNPDPVPADSAPDSPALPAGRRILRRVLVAAAFVAFAALLWVLFLAYLQPGLLLEFVNLRYCG